MSAAFCPGRWRPTLLELMRPPEASNVIEDKFGGLGDALARIAWPPLTPRRVDAGLGISAQERARWTKDAACPARAGCPSVGVSTPPRLTALSDDHIRICLYAA